MLTVIQLVYPGLRTGMQEQCRKVYESKNVGKFQDFCSVGELRDKDVYLV